MKMESIKNTSSNQHDKAGGDRYLFINNVIYSYVSFIHVFNLCVDGGSPGKSNNTQLLVNIKDVNDNAPRFYTSLFQEAVSESVPAGYSIVRVSNSFS